MDAGDRERREYCKAGVRDRERDLDCGELVRERDLEREWRLSSRSPRAIGSVALVGDAMVAQAEAGGVCGTCCAAQLARWDGAMGEAGKMLGWKTRNGCVPASFAAGCRLKSAVPASQPTKPNFWRLESLERAARC